MTLPAESQVGRRASARPAAGAARRRRPSGADGWLHTTGSGLQASYGGGPGNGASSICRFEVLAAVARECKKPPTAGVSLFNAPCPHRKFANWRGKLPEIASPGYRPATAQAG